MGLTVIPSVLWSDEESYDFVFTGVARGSVVAITARNWLIWPLGFDVMMERLSPSKVLCFGDLIQEIPEVTSYPEEFHLSLVK